ncbi:MAG: hypothetical protein Q7V88_19315 [Actinomycetota bacterium]|nr:hypothetical protein [Actinomycetota bacterium]
MDLSKFKTSDWLKVGGAGLFLIFGFFDWISVEYKGADVLGGDGGNVFDFFWTGTLPWILILATGVITVLLVTGTMKPGSLPWPLIMLGATALGALLLLIRLIFNPLEYKDVYEAGGAEVGRGIGMILSAVGGVVAAVGAFLGFKESGGDLNDLKDMNKLKASFGGAGGGTPPPPPPGMTPPPPPPGSTPPPPPPAG